MSSTVTALPRSGWWSWRLTPKIQIGWPLTSSCRRGPRPSGTRPAGRGPRRRRRSGRPARDDPVAVGDSADHGSTSSSRTCGVRTREHVRLGDVVRHRRSTRAATPLAVERLDARPHLPPSVGASAPPTSARRRACPSPASSGRPGVADERRDVVAPAPRRRPRGGGPPSTTGPDPRRSCARSTDDDDRDVVVAGAHVVGDVVLARAAAVGAVADERAVDVDARGRSRRRRCAARSAAGPRAGTATVRGTRRSGCGRAARRRPVERHLHVGVLREVADDPAASSCPAPPPASSVTRRVGS